MNRKLLEQPFESKYIKQRRGNYGATLDYIETHVVIQRLNDAFEGEWSFEISAWEQIADSDEVVVLGTIIADGISKQQFGSSTIKRAKNDGAVISIGDDLKSAASDALKKTATLFGVGLQLYGDSGQGQAPAPQQVRVSKQPAPPTKPKDKANGNAAGISGKDFDTLSAEIAKEIEAPWNDFVAWAKERFGTTGKAMLALVGARKSPRDVAEIKKQFTTWMDQSGDKNGKQPELGV